MHKSLLFGIFVSIIWTGCTGETVVVRNIENRSSDTLRFQLYKQGGYLTDTLEILPAGIYQVSIGSGNRAKEDPPDCATLVDSAYFEVIGGGTMTKLIQLNQNWEVESEQTKSAPPEYEHTCTFTISDSDIIK